MPTSEVERALDSLTSRTTFGLAFIVAFAVGVIAVLAWYGHEQSVQARQLEVVATETHSALCTFRHDLSVRYTANAKLLKDNPGDPIDIFGLSVPRDTLVTSTANQKSTLDALDILRCSA